MPTFPNPERIFHPEIDFPALSQEIWEFQLAHNPVLSRFCGLLDRREQCFLPIRFFKQFEVTSGDWKPEAVFGSSGTTGQQRSRHLVRSTEIYRQSHLTGYRHFYGEAPKAIFALLPNYLERQDSSLVHMVREWIAEFGLVGSGFYLDGFQELHRALGEAAERGDPILLIGVSFALLDFVEQFPITLPPGTVVMETGGMKGRKKEMVRSELHEILQKGFGLSAIHSEYGMTELLSQAYAMGGSRFRVPPWMRVVITDPYRPLHPQELGKAGQVNVIDLANVYACSFIQTEDLGKLHPDGTFEILGRLDHSELRGCNLMVADL